MLGWMFRWRMVKDALSDRNGMRWNARVSHSLSRLPSHQRSIPNYLVLSRKITKSCVDLRLDVQMENMQGGPEESQWDPLEWMNLSQPVPVSSIYQQSFGFES